MSVNFIKQFKEIVDSGFSSNVNYEGDRLLGKDGTFNVRKTGLRWIERFDVFHTLISMSWPRFFAVMLAGYLAMNLLFTTLYVVVGIDGLAGVVASDETSRILDAFFFSAQTLTTVGYGRVNPIGFGAEVVATCEAFVGLMSFALATGLLYGRFSRPRTKLVYSDNALLSPFGGGRALMARVANRRESQMIDVSARLMFSWVERSERDPVRRFYNLELEYDRVNLLSTSWTIVHPIVETSPLHGLTALELETADVEIILLLRGYDETHSQEVHSRTSYVARDIVWGARFTPVLGKNDRGQATIALDKLSSHEPAPLP
jgi:inward rectifier potassium channel